MIELTGVSKRFDGIDVLQDITLTVDRGKTTVLLGTSGCGKSTILRMILGLVEPDAGAISFLGKPVKKEVADFVRRRTGYVLQEGGLFPHLTAYKNVIIVAKHMGWSVEQIHARVQELAALVALDAQLLDRFPAELSGGQRQRISLMRALMLDPDVLLMDEPLGALDPITRADLQRELSQIFSRLKKTVLLVTHDLAEAAFFGDKTVLMNEGRIVQQGRLEDMLTKPADPFVTRFINAQNVDWRSNLRMEI